MKNLKVIDPKTPYERLAKLIYDTYLIVDQGILKLITAAVITHRLPLDPVWIFIVGASSGGKTELLNALNDVTGIFPLDSLTANTFISGQQRQGKQTSLLARIKNGIITLKDFTTILAMQKDVRGEIMGQLRKIYDGEFSKSFGTGQDTTWKGKITMIAGVTTSIYTTAEMYSAMGERFIMYAMQMPDRKEMAHRAVGNVTDINMNEKRQQIKTAMKEYFESVVVDETKVPNISDELKQELIDLANMATLARSAVDRDYRSQSKEITFVHDSEMPTRFATQLVSLACGMIVMNGGELTEEDKHILYKLTLDSIHKIRRRCMQELTKNSASDTAGMAMALTLPSNSVRRYLEELNALGIVTKLKESQNRDIWMLKPEFRAIMSKFDGIEMLNQTLTESLIETQENEARLAATKENIPEETVENISAVFGEGVL